MQVGLLSQGQLAAWLPEQRDLDLPYFLGPKGRWRRSSATSGIGVPEQQSRYEFFGGGLE